MVADPTLVARLHSRRTFLLPGRAQATECARRTAVSRGQETVDRKQLRLVRGGWAANHDQANKNGTDGEQWVVDRERETSGRSDLADASITWPFGSIGYGYDVCRSIRGARVAHESRRRSRPTPFAVTPNELRTSQADPSNFYRVFDYGPGGLYILEGDLEPLLELTPTQYSARLKPRVVNLRGFAAGRHDGRSPPRSGDSVGLRLGIVALHARIARLVRSRDRGSPILALRSGRTPVVDPLDAARSVRHRRAFRGRSRTPGEPRGDRRAALRCCRAHRATATPRGVPGAPDRARGT